MSFAKAAVLGVLITGWAESPVRADPMLFLGTFSNQPSPGPFSPSPWASTPPAPPANAAVLSLGISGGAAASPAPAFQAPAPPPAPVVNPPPPAPVPTLPPAAQVAMPPSGVYDAFISLGSGPYPNAGSLTTGNASPWYTSGPVQSFYGGMPTPQQRADFDNAVVQRVAQTFRQSGVGLSLTSDPNAAAAHTISVVANTTNPVSGQVIGMTYIGGNGFHFIDQSARSARDVDQLEWIVAHNVSHELMLAFGVPENHDTTGRFIDARNANLSMMVDPDAQFSSAASRDLLSRNFQSAGPSTILMGAQLLDAPAVPEPSTVALWLLGGSALWLGRRFRPADRRRVAR